MNGAHKILPAPASVSLRERLDVEHSPAYAQLLERIRSGAERSKLECRQYGEISTKKGAYPLMSLSTPAKTRSGRRGVLIVAGIHGDEPAGIEAIVEMLQRGLPDSERFWFAIFPCVNPSGYEQRTRAAASGIDLNRVFSRRSLADEVRAMIAALECATLREGDSFACVVDLHEDNPAQPCDFSHCDLRVELPYIYQHLRGHTECLGDLLSKALAREGHLLCDGNTLYGDLCVEGVISYGERLPNRALNDLLHFANFAVRHLTQRVFTIETPIIGSLTDRRSFHIAAVREILALL